MSSLFSMLLFFFIFVISNHSVVLVLSTEMICKPFCKGFHLCNDITELVYNVFVCTALFVLGLLGKTNKLFN